MEELRGTVAEALGIDVEDLAEDASTENQPEWTSLQHLNVIAAVEEHFGVQLSMDEMTSAQSLESIYRIIRAYRGDRQ